MATYSSDNSVSYSSNYEQWSETDVKIRPVKNKRASKPRTKIRPDHAEAVRAMVVSVDRGRYRAVVDDGTVQERIVKATRAKELRSQAIVVGDFVKLVGDLSGERGTLARIIKIEKRKTVLRRSADDSDTFERVIVANSDQILIVTAAQDPEPRPGFIDRALITAYDSKIKPFLLITKTDKKDPSELVSLYEDLDVPILLSRSEKKIDEISEKTADSCNHLKLDQDSLEKILRVLKNHRTVLIGPSGVGKSTLINALTGSNRAVGDVNSVTGRGRHTSSSALALQVKDENDDALSDSWIIDTPGIRSFGLGFVSTSTIIEAFEDLQKSSLHCPKGCSHLEDEPSCQLDLYDNSPNYKRRLESLRRLLKTKNAP